MFSVEACFDDGRLLDRQTAPTMAAALRLAWSSIGGISSAEACIRRFGPALLGYLKCDWRGELAEAEVYGPSRLTAAGYPAGVVIPLNPNGPLFAEEIAQAEEDGCSQEPDPRNPEDALSGASYAAWQERRRYHAHMDREE